MRTKTVIVTGVLLFGLWHTGKGKNCGAVAWVESITTSASMVKSGVADTACEVPPCPTKRYQTTKIETTKHQTTIYGPLRLDYYLMRTQKNKVPVVAFGAPMEVDETNQGHYSAEYNHGSVHEVCPDTTFNVSNPSFCAAYSMVLSELPAPDWNDITNPNDCPAVSREEDSSTWWIGSYRTQKTTYEDPITDATLKGKVQAAAGDPPSSGQWGGGGSSSYALSIESNQTGTFVKGTGSKSRYRFKVAGAEAGQHYEIRWEVWEKDPRGVRLYKKEKTTFTGSGTKFQYVDGRILDLPSWNTDECQETGSAIRFVKMESIQVESQDKDGK